MKKLITLSVVITAFSSFAQQAAQQWLNRYNGSGNFEQKFNCSVSDASGNIYAAGYEVIVGNRQDYLLVKYDSNGNLLWSKTYDGVGGKDDEILAMTIDAGSNVYVTGYSKGSTTNDDIVTIKYDASGNQVWLASYNNATSNDDDQGNAIALDAQGNIVVAGQTDTDASVTSNDDFILVKYSSAGVQTWTATFNGTGNGKDRALKVATNVANEIIVTGRSDNGSDDDIVTKKYTSTGTVSWTKTVNNGMNDRPADLKIDASSNIYIAGFSNNGNDDDFIVLKYSTSGTASWGATGVTYDGVNNLDDRAFSLVVDGSGNCYVTGRSDSDPNVTNYDFCTIKVSAAGSVSWNKTYNGSGSGTDEGTSICLLSNGNVVVSGKSDSDASATSSNYNVVSICYTSTGTQSWLQSFAGVSDDVPAMNHIDNTGNVIISGYITDANGFDEAMVLKYTSTGSLTWNKSFKGLGDNSDNSNAIAIDNQGNTYVAGYTYTKDMRDMLIMKINSTGDTLWTRTYNGTDNGMDEATDIQVDATGNVYVTGFTKESLSDYDVTTIKYSSTGGIVWTAQFDNTSVNGEDKGNKLLVDASGNVYVSAYTDMDATTATNNDMILIKYNASGVQQWIKPYSGVGDDEPVDLVFSGTNVVICGKTTNATDLDMITIAYNPTGVQQWSKTYASTGTNDDVIYDMIADNSGNVFITGKSDDGVNSDAVTIAYTPSGTQSWLHTYTSGSNREKGVSMAITTTGGLAIAGTSSDGLQNDVLVYTISASGASGWITTYDGGGAMDDVPSSIVKDANGDFIVAGKTDVMGATVQHSNLLLRKYGSATGNVIWSVTYDGAIEGNDGANAMVLNSANDIILAGYSQSTVGQKDIVVLKYSNPGTGAGIEEIKSQNETYLYPNPMIETATITNLEELNGNKTLSIFQMDGRCVRNEVLNDNSTFEKATLRAGTYIFNVSNGEKSISGKFIIE